MDIQSEYPVGSYVTTETGIATVIGYAGDELRLIGDTDDGFLVEASKVTKASDVPDLETPEGIEEFLNRVDITTWDKPPAAVSTACSCACGSVGGCYRVSSNNFHMSNTRCMCAKRECGCVG